ncbi:MAG TPA: regulatory iron-sulfur-containing complex subunit RicT [Planctomycetota bacterium]|nr:regulatory iron-sulfur-containing complex subunit RicT [Planctomycetota bacterium]
MATVLARYSMLRLHEHFRVPENLPVKVGDMVVLRTKRGTETGQVKSLPQDRKLNPEETIAGEVLRRMTQEDATRQRELKATDNKPVIRTCRKLVQQHKLPMRVIAVERLLVSDKLIVYFESEDRLDFRDLVKDVNRELNTRVELRQVGARDAARLTGDVGVCGQELCCVSYIVDFVPVSMKMAKNQRASLDPNKISGMCGRLKCCLKYEDDLYTELQKNVPLEGQPCKCEGHDCTACNVDILGQKVTVDFGDGKREIRDVKDITFDASWTEKDVRRYQKEVWAKREEERQKRLAAGERRARERTESRERRAKQQSEHPQRRVTDHRKTEGAAQVTAVPEPPPPADAAQLPSVPPPAPADERPVVSESGRLPPPDDPQPGPES